MISSQKWNALVAKVAFVQFDDQRDLIIWNLNNKGSFTVQSIYKHLVNQIAFHVHKTIWKLKLPLKIKVFVWFFIKEVILIKDNLIKNNWKCVETCCFCNNKETIQHLFFDCNVAYFVWRVVQDAFGLLPPKTQNIFLGLAKDKLTLNCDPKFMWEKCNYLVYMVEPKCNTHGVTP